MPPNPGIEPGERRYLLIGLTLSFVGGFADCGSYVLEDSFTGHITGNMILLMVHLANARWPQALSCLIAVAAFLAGTAGGRIWPSPPDRSVYQRLAPILALETVLVVVGMIIPMLAATGGKDVFLAALCLALGLQNGAVGKIGAVTFHTTFITGMSTTLVETLVAGKTGLKRRLLSLIIAGFVLGACSGALAVTRLGVTGFAIVPALLLWTWYMARTGPAESGAPTSVS